MSLFRRQPQPEINPMIHQATNPTPSPPRPNAMTTTDWADTDNIRGEWTDLESEDQAMLSWRNGMSMYDQGPIPAQRLNVAEYITRALAYTLVGRPLLSDEQAVESVRRVLTMLASLPAEPAWLADFAPRLIRLALAVARMHSWQPTALGGDGHIPDDLVVQVHNGPFWGSITSPGIDRDEVIRHFFSQR